MLKTLRKQRGLTLQEAARRAYVDAGNLSKLEKGKGAALFSSESLLRIASVYEISPKELLAMAGKCLPTTTEALSNIRSWLAIVDLGQLSPTSKKVLLALADLFGHELRDI
jgi:transcriptional regulator with XRE-family HTH domain